MKKLLSILAGICITISTFATLPSKVYAPYVDVMLWPTFSLMNCYNATGQKYYTLAFITSNGTQPAWGGITTMDQNFMLDQINQLRSVGGDVIVSFGGANGTPIDASITNVNSLVSAYQSVINRYGLTWIDFDIEGYWLSDQASIDRRNQAAKILQTNNPGLRITYCLPVSPSGLTADGVNVINKAKAAGVNIYSVNVMAMDYGGPNGAMGSAAISAAQGTRNQTGLNIGVTPMIGQNDSAGEIFSLSNASEVLSFANSNGYVNMIAMWSANRDNGGCPGQTSASATCSGLSQSNFAFVNTFKSFSGNTGGNGVATFYKDCNYGGYAVGLNVGTYTLSQMIAAGILNDDVSSVKVNSGYKVTLYWDDNFGGSTKVLTSNMACDGTWNDKTSSIKIETNTTSGWSTKVEAENWSYMAGVQTESTTDAGGGLNVGWIDAGDWMAYNVTIPSAGTYKVIYRVASPNNGTTLRLEKDAGATQLGSVNIPNTGGWQNWTNVSHNVTLPAGTYSIGIATSTGGFNLNYFTITNNLSARAVEEVETAETDLIVLSPNPVEDELFINSIEKVTRIKVINMQGREVISVENPGRSVSVQSLAHGLHIAVLEKENNTIVKKKFIKK